MIGYKPIEYSLGRMTAKKNMMNLGEFWLFAVVQSSYTAYTMYLAEDYFLGLTQSVDIAAYR